MSNQHKHCFLHTVLKCLVLCIRFLYNSSCVLYIGLHKHCYCYMHNNCATVLFACRRATTEQCYLITSIQPPLDVNDVTFTSHPATNTWMLGTTMYTSVSENISVACRHHRCRWLPLMLLSSLCRRQSFLYSYVQYMSMFVIPVHLFV